MENVFIQTAISVTFLYVTFFGQPAVALPGTTPHCLSHARTHVCASNVLDALQLARPFVARLGKVGSPCTPWMHEMGYSTARLYSTSVRARESVFDSLSPLAVASESLSQVHPRSSKVAYRRVKLISRWTGMTVIKLNTLCSSSTGTDSCLRYCKHIHEQNHRSHM